ncbi:hypothetical protein Purlil1_12897 [Purpureocillium lilacinum]|uniref:Nephrocystin 3-like N-terminal domain-containing protein n=1 Tax=Purpureocillium lilacinum TaxID=33203 RepID=A0ABR0BFU6_PURLI|nr:hypothetical protein Purlil1_12897 [Purpureocillium lilacinum]
MCRWAPTRAKPAGPASRGSSARRIVSPTVTTPSRFSSIKPHHILTPHFTEEGTQDGRHSRYCSQTRTLPHSCPNIEHGGGGDGGPVALGSCFTKTSQQPCEEMAQCGHELARHHDASRYQTNEKPATAPLDAHRRTANARATWPTGVNPGRPAAVENSSLRGAVSGSLAGAEFTGHPTALSLLVPIAALTVQRKTLGEFIFLCKAGLDNLHFGLWLSYGTKELLDNRTAHRSDQGDRLRRFFSLTGGWVREINMRYPSSAQGYHIKHRKGARTEQVELFEKLVQELHNLVPSVVIQGKVRRGDTSWTEGAAIPSHWGLRLLTCGLSSRDATRTPLLAWPALSKRTLPRLPPEEGQQHVQLDTGTTRLSALARPRGLCGTEAAVDQRTCGVWKNDSLCPRRAHVVEHLTSNLDTPVAQCLFTSDFEGRDDPYLALRSWVSQIVSHHESAYEHVRKRWESDSDPLATRATIITVFKELLDVVAGCTFVADGLDECAYSDNSSTSVAKFVHDVTMRLLGRMLEFSVILPEDVRSDNAAYSQSIVNRKLPNKSDDLRATLSEAMTDRCQGQFLWLKLQEESLREGMNKKRLQDAIANTPTGLAHLYDRNWTRVTQLGEWERHRVYALLRWTAFALRPLTVCEITEAALIDESEDFPLEDLPDDVDDASVNSEIIGWIRQNDNLRTSYEQLQNTLLAKACLQYVSSGQVWEDIPYDSLPSTGMSFRSYAATTCYQHINLGLPKDVETARLSVRFLSRTNPAWDSWRTLVESETAERQEQEAETIPPGPFLRRSALVIAYANGYIDVVDVLIEKGADITIADNDGWTPVNSASANGHAEVVKLPPEQ